jgi:hypothetical protein
MTTINDYIKKRIKDIADINVNKDTRQREIVEYRALYCFLVRKYTNQSLPQIAKTLKRNHATIIHSLKCFEMYERYNEKLRNARTVIEDELVNKTEFTISSKTLSQELLSLNYELREEIKRLKKLEKYLNTPTFISNLIDNYENLNNFERVQVKESIESITSRYQVEDCSSS